jgi:hypothetical protein
MKVDGHEDVVIRQWGYILVIDESSAGMGTESRHQATVRSNAGIVCSPNALPQFKVLRAIRTHIHFNF